MSHLNAAHIWFHCESSRPGLRYCVPHIELRDQHRAARDVENPKFAGIGLAISVQFLLVTSLILTLFSNGLELKEVTVAARNDKTKSKLCTDMVLDEGLGHKRDEQV